MFSTQSDTVIVSPFVHHVLDIVSLFAAELEEPQIGVSGKGTGLILTCTFYSFSCYTQTIKHHLKTTSQKTLFNPLSDDIF